MEEPLSVLEFYSGIGGTHYALDRADIKYKVIGAFDINTTANIVYKHNFPDTKHFQKNIDGFTVEYLDRFNADIWTMSPPCQPYTRQGKQAASKDNRSKSFLNLLNILQEMTNPPEYIFMENVKGFESSDTREVFIDTLNQRNFVYQEFLISPTDIGIPNSRTRYYMIAKAKHLACFASIPSLLSFPLESCTTECECKNGVLCFRKALEEYVGKCPQCKISDLINADVNEDYLIHEDVLMRYHMILDIVHPESSKSCCFTKAYGKYVEGTGSVFTQESTAKVSQIYSDISLLTSDKEKYVLLSKLKLRYFTPEEIGKLMCFPTHFVFPDVITLKQKYRLLGNSVNVFVISCLMKWFLFNHAT